jgi:putative DNA primase/helicase
LREEFAELRSEEEERIRRGQVEPWDEPVNTCELLDTTAAQFEKYIIVHDRVIVPIIPLWFAFAWVHEIAAFSPLLNFQAADAEAGKSAATEVATRLTPRGYMIVKPTGPSLYRLVDRAHPTLGVDDADKLLAEDRDLAMIVRASWKRGVYIPRVVQGEVHLFDAFGPRCLNGIDLLAHLDAATRTRCITIQLLPKLEGEIVTSIRYAGEDENFIILRRKFLRWATDNMAALKAARPRMPEGFFSRLEENYHLLFAIADLAAGDWPKKARAAAVRLSREHNEPSLGKRLLAIFYTLFVRHGPQLTSRQAEQLTPAEDDEFDNYRDHDRPINKFEIAKLLRPYQVFPRLIHPRGGHTADRGWNADSFEIAFKHYLGKTLPQGRSVVRTRRVQK